MRRYINIISAISFFILGGKYFINHQYIWAILFCVAGSYYLWRIIFDCLEGIKKNKIIGEMNANNTVKLEANEMKEIINNLKSSLTIYKKNMSIFRNLSLIGLICIVWIAYHNINLAIVCFILLIPIGYKLYISYKGVKLIERGLMQHNCTKDH
ncbi:MAG: hypothetical protein PWP27_1450 [Clostridiales bacterium]|nr:hypothetical protein [Clostridiales bacterium]MDK2933640.1 hypothetical protein [Clostridiales bacterium]